jgi:hypothetical protein
MLNSDLSADSAPRETPPPLVVGKNPCRRDVYRGKIHSNEKRRKRRHTVQCIIQTASVSSVHPPLNTIPLHVWPIQMCSVKDVDHFAVDFMVFRCLPAGGYVVVTGPLDEKTQVPIATPRVKHAVDFPFLSFLDNH